MTGAWIDTRSETIQRAIGKAKDELLITAPDADTLRGISLVEGVDWPRHVRLLTTKPRAKQLRTDFITATRIADLIQNDVLELRTVPGDEPPLHPLLITSDDITCLLLPGQTEVAAVQTAVEDVHHYVRGEYLTAWGRARVFDLQTPAYSEILQSIGEEFEQSMRTDAETMLQTSLSTRTVGERLDEIHLILLLAAKHQVRYDDVTQWGELVGLGSPAKFSKRKQELEEAGLLVTTNVETGRVGRPPQRLMFPDNHLQEARVEEVIAAAQSVIA